MKKKLKPLKSLQCKKWKETSIFIHFIITLQQDLLPIYMEENIHAHFFGIVSEFDSCFSLSLGQKGENQIWEIRSQMSVLTLIFSPTGTLKTKLEKITGQSCIVRNELRNRV